MTQPTAAMIFPDSLNLHVFKLCQRWISADFDMIRSNLGWGTLLAECSPFGRLKKREDDRMTATFHIFGIDQPPDL